MRTPGSDDELRDLVGGRSDAIMSYEKSKDHVVIKSKSEIGSTVVILYKDILYLDSMLIAPEHQGKNEGTKQFAKIVDIAKAKGLRAIEMDAARDDDLNGYYTWARLGVGGKVPAELQAGARKALGRKYEVDITDLMLNPAGREWWREHGDSYDGVFTLKVKKGELNYSDTIFSSYRKAKGL